MRKPRRDIQNKNPVIRAHDLYLVHGHEILSRAHELQDFLFRMSLLGFRSLIL